MLRILLTGNYDSNYNRNLILIKGLIQAGIEIQEFPFKEKNLVNAKRLRSYNKEADLVFLPSFTHKEVTFVKRHSVKPVLFDPLVSRYLTKVYDYKSIAKYSFSALKNYWLDKKATRLADHVITDTIAHKFYFSKISGMPDDHFSVLPVGVCTQDFYPLVMPRQNKTIVGYYGGFIPLHGLKNIIEAAYLLNDTKDIEFHLIGTGYEYKKTLGMIKKFGIGNVKLKGWSEYSDLNLHINTFDICLGIFGETPKAFKVVPNKIYHYSACRKATITLDTPAIHEVFSGSGDVMLCSAKAEDIAAKIMTLKKDEKLRESIAGNAYELVSGKYNQYQIAMKFIELVIRKFPHLSEKVKAKS